MKKLLMIAGLAELGTGVALMAATAMVGKLLLGEELTGVALPVARVLGIALAAIGVGCIGGSVRIAMWCYTFMATLYLAYLGLYTDWAGILLWPAVVVHGVLTVGLAKRGGEKS